MKNIHLIATDKPSRLYLDRGKLWIDNLVYGSNNQHIYITNSEDIKEGDWFINKFYIDKRAPIASQRFAMNSNAVFSNPKKIILTTDQDLIADGVQAIDDEFLEWFVSKAKDSGKAIDIVEIEKIECQMWSLIGCNKDDAGCCGKPLKGYKIIIPKEEPKQDTISEAAEKRIPTSPKVWDLTETRRSDFIAGANYQAERMYSEEEVLELLKKSHFVEQNIEEWFEQFKKK
jgi:hypothetical protein